MTDARIDILLVEDNPGDARLIREMLKETEYASATLHVTGTLKEALAHPVDPAAVTMVLLDLNLPDSTGPATLRKVIKSYPQNAIVVLTGLADELMALKALRQGAQSYLTKDTIGPGELAKTIRYSIERHGFVMRIRESDNEMLVRERRFRSLIDHSSDLTLLVDRDGKVTYASPSVHRLYGFTPFGMNAFKALHPSDAHDVRQRFEEALTNPESSLPILMRTRTVEGTVFVMEGTIMNLLHVEGVSAMVVNLHDVSERVAALESVAFERNNQRALINSSMDMIWSVDRDLRVITANKSFTKRIKTLGGYDVEPGKSIVPPIHFGTYDSEKWKEYYTRALNGESFTVEEHATEPELVWGEFTFNPIHEGNKVVGVACAGRDVTRRKRAEEELRLLNAELEQRVLDRTRELTQVNADLSEQIKQNVRLSELLVQRNEDLMASITYARRIQEGISHTLTGLSYFPDKAHLMLPRDVVSGDFLWHHETDEHVFVIIGDCTGHGVPGALMSMLGHSILCQLIMDRRMKRPEMILSGLDQALYRLFAQPGTGTRISDGMDAGCMVVEKGTMRADYAGALLKAMIIRDGEIQQIDCTRASIGGFHRSEQKKFSSTRFMLEPGDRVVLSTDGFCSQFGGERGRKMKPVQFRELLLGCAHLPAKEAIEHLGSSFHTWMGAEPQVDDVLVALLDV